MKLWKKKTPPKQRSTVEINIAGDAYQIQFDLSEQGRQTDG